MTNNERRNGTLGWQVNDHKRLDYAVQQLTKPSTYFRKYKNINQQTRQKLIVDGWTSPVEYSHSPEVFDVFSVKTKSKLQCSMVKLQGK